MPTGTFSSDNSCTAFFQEHQISRKLRAAMFQNHTNQSKNYLKNQKKNPLTIIKMRLESEGEDMDFSGLEFNNLMVMGYLQGIK